MQTVSINEAITLQFVTLTSEYEATLIMLRMLGYKPTYEDATRENMPKNYPVATGRPEVVFNLPVKDITEAAFVRQLLKHHK